MSEHRNERPEPAPPAADPTALRDAKRIWRRAAVRRADRRLLLAELSDELTAADADGLPASAVVGDDPELTLRAWADERGVSGRALRLVIVVPVALIGIAIGFALLAAVLYVGFTTNELRIEPAYLILGLYAATALLAYLLAVAGTFTTLRLVRDPRPGGTARWLAAILPAGAAVATAAGVGVARLLGFTTEPRTFVAVITVVCVALVATAIVARYLATRPRAASEFSTAAA
ncbi:hypothetical protein [Prescottella agglutinans]|uniref:Uncharacterized protein n=1 Tax=Prescottella agglutinans TaxID=1644129 RepID=A0ABT6MK10_9NOCA|nr:hypothetical protein [Prescottella agglutinans]MDH6284219.1 hypothetical protein [Prescottella agglutinans]